MREIRICGLLCATLCCSPVRLFLVGGALSQDPRTLERFSKTLEGFCVLLLICCFARGSLENIEGLQEDPQGPLGVSPGWI